MINLPELRSPSVTGSTEALKDQQVGFDILKCILRHKSLCALGIIISLVLGSLYYAQQTPIYESSAKILIVNKRPETVGGGTASYFNDYMSTHQALVVSPVVVERAIQKEGISNIGVAEVINGLRVSAGTTGQGANNILTLSFRGKVPAECVTVVNAVLASYQDFLEETYNNMSTNTLELMSEARDNLLVELRKQEFEYREFRQDSPLIYDSENGQSQSRLSMIQAEQSELLMKKTELESQLATIQKAKEEGKSSSYISELISNLSGDKRGQGEAAQSNTNSQQDSLLILLQKEKELLQFFGANHPTVASVRLRIKENRESRETPEWKAQKAKNTEQYVEYLRQEIVRIDALQNLLVPMHESEFAAAKELTHYRLRDEEFKRNMERTQQLYDGVIAQLQDVKLSKDFGGFKADVINPPQFGRKVEPRLSTVILSAIVLGCLLGTLLAAIAELGGNGFITLEEIREKIDLPVMGHIPRFALSATVDPNVALSRLDNSLSSYHSPRSAESEAYRGLRTGLYFRNRDQVNKVIQITSACPGDGKSTIASNLSVCIAQSGKRVLLIDADMRRPRQHDIFGISSRFGLSTVIALDQEFDDAVTETLVKNLSLLPAGPIPPDPAELLTSERFHELLMLLRDKYDYIIIDTGPLLAVSDPSIVTAKADGVIMAVRLRKTKRKQVERAKEILDALRAPTIGIVANAITSSPGKSYGYYYYGHYHRDPTLTQESSESTTEPELIGNSSNT